MHARDVAKLAISSAPLVAERERQKLQEYEASRLKLEAERESAFQNYYTSIQEAIVEETKKTGKTIVLVKVERGRSIEQKDRLRVLELLHGEGFTAIIKPVADWLVNECGKAETRNVDHYQISCEAWT